MSTVLGDRIGYRCWYCYYDCKTKNVHDWQRGRLRAWSTDHEETEQGPGHFPVGIFEDIETGLCHSVSVGRISFGAGNPGEQAQ